MDSSINIRIDGSTKKQADKLFKELGLNMSTAVNIFIRQSLREQRIPFEINANPTTIAAMQEARDIASGKVVSKQYSDTQALFDDILNDV